MNPKDIEWIIVEDAAKNIPIEHIRYKLDKEYNYGIDEDALELLIKSLREKIQIQKEINESKSKNNIIDLIQKLNNSIDELQKVINEAKESNNSKVTIAAIQQLHAIVITLAKLAGELKEQQELQVSNFYIKISSIKEYLKDNIEEILRSYNEEERERFLKRLKCGSEPTIN